MITGEACRNSKPPPIPSPPLKYTFSPICVHNLIVAHVFYPLYHFQPSAKKIRMIKFYPQQINLVCQHLKYGPAIK